MPRKDSFVCPACGCDTFSVSRTTTHADKTEAYIDLDGKVTPSYIISSKPMDISFSNKIRCYGCGRPEDRRNIPGLAFQQKKGKYIDSKIKRCLFCHSGDIELAGQPDIDGNQLKQRVQCNNCINWWFEIYGLYDLQEAA